MTQTHGCLRIPSKAITPCAKGARDFENLIEWEVIMRGGDAVIHALEKEGIAYITGFQGGGLNPLWPALRASETLQAFATRHERLDRKSTL